MKKSPISKVFIYLAAIMILIFTLFPFYWMLTASLKSFREIFMDVSIFPRKIVFDNYVQLFNQTNILGHIRNSLITAIIATMITMIMVSMTAYITSRYKVFIVDLLAKTTLFTYMVPSIVLVIPLFMAIRAVGLIDSHTGLVISYLTITLPFGIWMMRSFFDKIPRVMEDAALIDGANKFQSFIFVVIPQAMPGIISTSIFVFILCWGEFLFPIILLSSESMKTLPVTLESLVGGGQNIQFGLLMAASTVATLPIILIFLFMQKYLVTGFAAGGYD